MIITEILNKVEKFKATHNVLPNTLFCDELVDHKLITSSMDMFRVEVKTANGLTLGGLLRVVVVKDLPVHFVVCLS